MKIDSSKKIIRNLKKYGFCKIENIFSPKECEKKIKELKILHNKVKKNKNYVDELSKNGQVIIRDLVLRDPKSFLKLIDNKVIIKVLKKFFKDTFILDNCMASNSVALKKNNYKALIHIDSHLPTKDTENTSDIVVMFCFNDFTKDNGATKIWPTSHLSGERIQKNKNILKKRYNKFKYATAKKGSLIFFLGQTWHQIGKNINGKDRWGILCHYKRWWIKPSTDFTKCGPKIFKMLNNNQKQLFGFNSISPKFNFKKQIKKLKTLRKISILDAKYRKVLHY